jgi:hypothetical protein
LRPPFNVRWQPPWHIGDPVPPRPTYLRTYEQLRTDLTQLAQQHPDLVTIEDVGPSADTIAGRANRPLFALRVGSGLAADAAIGRTRPKLLVTGGVHADETANPELVARSIEDLVNGYGTDPQATWLLDNREIVAVPMVNPDGRAAVEQGFATGDGSLIYHRRSSSAPDGGVDLNRNFDYHWGSVGGSTDPANKNYRGPSAASEPEVQAVEALVRRERPNLLIDWHSRGDLVLLPYGDTAAPAADDAGLRALAGRFAALTEYAPETSWQFHPDSGTLKDWAYGTLGIPSFTIETGVNHHQQADEFADTMARDEPVLRLAAAVCDAPLERGKSGQLPAGYASAAAGAAQITPATRATTTLGTTPAPESIVP